MKLNEYQTILTDYADQHLKITLNRPEKRNALNALVVDELKDIFNKSKKLPELRTVSLEAVGDVFCSGLDLNYLKTLKNFDHERNLQDSLSLSELFLTIYTHPTPTIAIVRGPALAGGCGLASVCDFILATQQAKFGYPEVKIGFIASLVSAFLIRQIGERRARDLLLSGRIIPAEEALRLGLINEVIDSDLLQNRLLEIITNLKANSPLALTATKKLLDSFNFTQIKEELHNKAVFNAEFRQTDDFLEGISSFLEKRKPNWLKNK